MPLPGVVCWTLEPEPIHTNVQSPAEVRPSSVRLAAVAVTLSLEVGRARMAVRDLLQLAPGAIVELDRAASEPLDVLVNGVRIARGEVVVVNDKFGIRLTDVVSATERMEQAR